MSSDRPRLILHIGTHKTGTTALQTCFETQREPLRQAGVCYPSTQRQPWPDLPKHCSVYQAATSEDAAQRQAEGAHLLDEWQRSGARHLLVSEEGLSEPDPRLPSFFELPWTCGFEITVVCLLRRQDIFVESLFNQFVRESARREARSPLNFARAPMTRQRLDYHTLLSRWAAIGARVVALDFDSLLIRQQGLLHAFAGAAGLPLEGLQATRANRSADMRLALALNELNRQRQSYRLEPLLQASRRLQAAGWPVQRHVLGGEERRRLLADCLASNELLQRDYGVAFDPHLPADEPPLAQERADADYLLALLAELSQA